MPNMAIIISRHNKALLAQRTKPASTVSPCNCRAKTSCLMKGQCHERSIIYKATLTTDGIANNYYDCSETEFKTRFYNHNQSFRTSKSLMPLSYLRLFGKLKTQERRPSVNGALQPAPHHTTWELDGATSA